jgi:hypothetical protein
MSTIERGRKITLVYKLDENTGKATLTMEVSAGSDILPHEHREDMRSLAAELLTVPVAALEGVDVVMKRVPGPVPHTHDDDHEHEHGEHTHTHPEKKKEEPPPPKPVKA